VKRIKVGLIGVILLMSEDLKLFLEDLTDFLNGQEASLVKLRVQIGKLLGAQEKVWTWDCTKIAWSKASGAKGEYERSEDVNSLDFKSMLKDLAAHAGSLVRDGVFYWTFQNGSTVGRKKRTDSK
jgi:hypothetical protein